MLLSLFTLDKLTHPHRIESINQINCSVYCRNNGTISDNEPDLDAMQKLSLCGGGLLALLLIIFGLFWFCCYRRRDRLNNEVPRTTMDTTTVEERSNQTLNNEFESNYMIRTSCRNVYPLPYRQTISKRSIDDLPPGYYQHLASKACNECSGENQEPPPPSYESVCSSQNCIEKY